jgi:hypothetical protein
MNPRSLIAAAASFSISSSSWRLARLLFDRVGFAIRARDAGRESELRNRATAALARCCGDSLREHGHDLLEHAHHAAFVSSLGFID